ncbi:MAG: CD1375 family protein [Oscillospiraceae bacterium]|nr:CD1375 family protein [Oscillospiraceae bacterium]MDY2863390.1 CD1375 family protein [Oscillospiraceae bacterium]
MVKIFVYQIRCGKMTVDDVPEKWREAVKNALNEV